jgi:hypothetical protein
MHLVCLFTPHHAVWAPPTVADAKMKFIGAFKKPLPGLYSTIVQELLVQQHLFRWNKKYQYNEVNRLACVSSTHGWVTAGLSGWPQADNQAVMMCGMLYLSRQMCELRVPSPSWPSLWPRPAAGHCLGHGLHL